MRKGVTVLDFDRSYQWQTFLRDLAVEWIDLTDIPGTKRYCAVGSLATIRQRLKRRRSRGVTLIGSGNYHYVTYLLLSEITTPFSLVLFDYHTDLTESLDGELVSCGSWVLRALTEIPLLQEVLIIGAHRGANETLAKLPEPLKRRVSVVEQGSEGWALIPATLSRLSTRNVYISIDKDVLDRTEAVTDWEQGAMKLPVLLELIRAIGSHRQVCGADICGEYPMSPLEALGGRGRLAVRKNARVNQALLKTFGSIDLSVLPLSS